MRDLTPWRYKLTSAHYYLDLIRGLFRSKKKDKLYGYVKFMRGDEVKVTIYSDNPNRWYRGKVIDVNARYVLPDVEESWKVEYYVKFKNDNNKEVRAWYLESELVKYTLQEERNIKLKELGI